MDRAKVLLVEDDLDWSSSLQTYFASETGFEIVACVDSKEACVSALDAIAVDVVLMDIMLGIAHKHPGIKVIIVSSLDNDDEVFNEAFLNGAYDFVYKNEFEQIPATIAGAMKDQATKYGPPTEKTCLRQEEASEPVIKTVREIVP